jgi:Zn-finger nucleic acid-binding protein
MKCPACFNELRTVTAGALAVDVCYGGCGGIWFDAFELQQVDEHTESAGEVLVDIVRNPEVHVDHKSKRECPRCAGIKLKRHFFSALRKVEVDQCPNCSGYWLDHGELLAIRAERQAHASRKRNAEGMPIEVIRYLYRLRTQAAEQ